MANFNVYYKVCPICGNPLQLINRTYMCRICGYILKAKH